MVFLGFGKYVRADRIYALEPITGDDRGNGRRTLVWVEGIAEPVVASRTQETILEEMAREADARSVPRAGRAGPVDAHTRSSSSKTSDASTERRRASTGDGGGAGAARLDAARRRRRRRDRRDRGVLGGRSGQPHLPRPDRRATRSCSARPATCTCTARTGSTGARTSSATRTASARRCCCARSSRRTGWTSMRARRGRRRRATAVLRPRSAHAGARHHAAPTTAPRSSAPPFELLRPGGARRLRDDDADRDHEGGRVLRAAAYVVRVGARSGRPRPQRPTTSVTFIRGPAATPGGRLLARGSRPDGPRRVGDARCHLQLPQARAGVGEARADEVREQPVARIRSRDPEPHVARGGGEPVRAGLLRVTSPGRLPAFAGMPIGSTPSGCSGQPLAGVGDVQTGHQRDAHLVREALGLLRRVRARRRTRRGGYRGSSRCRASSRRA